MIPIHNDGDTNRYVAGVCIPPGETKLFDPGQLPPGSLTPAEPAPAADPDAVLDILDGSVDEVAAALPGLDDTDLARLRLAEEAGKTRKGVLAALDEEDLRRASAAQDKD